MNSFFKQYLPFLSLLGLMGLFTGCEEKKVNVEKDQNTKSTILGYLTDNKYESVIELVDEQIKQGNSSSELLYYKASALSKKAGIDIFTLYPIFEMKLFSVSALDWDELKKFDNPYKKFFTFNSDKMALKNSDLRKKTVAFIEKMIEGINAIDESKIKNLLKISEELNDFYKTTGIIDLKLDGIINSENKVDYTKLDALLKELQEIVDDLHNLSLGFDKNSDAKLQDTRYIELNQKLVTTKKEIAVILGKLKVNLESANLKFGLDGFIQIDSDFATLYLNKLGSNIMDLLWSTYQTLPILSKLPRVVDPAKKATLNEAIKLLETVYDRNDDYRKNSGYYLSFLSAIMFVNSVINMSEIDYIESVDFICGLSESRVKANVADLDFYVRTVEKGVAEQKLSTKFFTKVNHTFQSLYGEKNQDGASNSAEIASTTEKNFDNILRQVKDKFCQ